MPEKYYVVGLDGDTNSVIVARGKDNPTLYARGLSVLASEFNWVAGSPPASLVAGGDRYAGAEAGERPAEAVGQPAAEGGTSGDWSDNEIKQAAGGVEGPRIRESPGVGGEAASGEFRCRYRCRHRQDLLPCTVKLVGAAPGDDRHGKADTVGVGFQDRERSGGGGEMDGPPSRSVMSVRFDEPAKAIAPGQVLALYKDGVCLGGGPIFRAEDHCAPVLIRTPPTQARWTRRRPRRRPTDRSAM